MHQVRQHFNESQHSKRKYICLPGISRVQIDVRTMNKQTNELAANEEEKKP